MDVPSTVYCVQSFARRESDAGIPDTANDRWTAKVWASANAEEIPDAYLRRARQQEVEAWYAPLSDESFLHWMEYYARGFYARRDECIIPEEATRLLEQAVERDCFTRFGVRFHRETKQYVLFGYYFDNHKERCAPIVGWYPEGKPLPTAEQLKSYFEERKAAEAAAHEAQEAERRKQDAQYRQERRRTQKLVRIHWAFATVVLAVTAALFFPLVGWWALSVVLLMLVWGWVVNDACSFLANPLRRLRWSLGTLSVLSMVALGATWLQAGTFTKELTLCSGSLSDEYAYETPEGEEYTLTESSYRQLFDPASYETPNAARVVAEVELNFFVGEPEVVSLRVTGDGYEACYGQE